MSHPRKYIPPVPPPVCELCGKVKYESELEAAQAAKFREKEFGPQWPYWSFNCNCWHLTSSPPDAKLAYFT